MNKLIIAMIILILAIGAYVGVAGLTRIWPFKKAAAAGSNLSTPVAIGGSCDLSSDCAQGPEGLPGQPGACVDGHCMYLIGTISSGRDNTKGLGRFCHSSGECNGGFRCVSNRDAATVHGIGNGGNCAQGIDNGNFTLKSTSVGCSRYGSAN